MSEGQKERERRRDRLGYRYTEGEGEGKEMQRNIACQSPESYFRRKSSHLGKIEGLDRHETGLGRKGS